MNRVFGIILGANEGESLVEFKCHLEDAEYEARFNVIGKILESKNYWDHDIISPACHNFWSRFEQFKELKNKRINVYYETQRHSIHETQIDNLQSLKLAVCMGLLAHRCAEKLDIRYRNICFTGTIHSGGELRVGEVLKCQEKYDLLVKQNDFAKAGEIGVFVYVSNEDIKTNGTVTAIRIPPGSLAADIIWKLSGKIVYPLEEKYTFKAAAFNYIREIFSKTKRLLRCTWYFSTTDSAECLFFFELLRELIKKGQAFEPEIFMPAAILGTDIVKDNNPYEKPAWYKRTEQENLNDAIKANNELVTLRELIMNEIAILQRLLFIYHPHRRLKVSLDENRSSAELMTSRGENALHIGFNPESGTEEYLVYTSAQKLGISGIDDADANDILKRLKTIFGESKKTKDEEPRIILIGPPGVGKTTITKKLTPANKRRLSSDPFINDHIFNDGALFPKEQWYTRNAFEGKNAEISCREREEREEQMIHIRELGEEAILRMVIATGDSADLGGKAIFFPKVQFFLRNHNFIIVLLIPELTEEERRGKNDQEIMKAEFEEYFKLYKNNSEVLLVEKDRRNVYAIMDEAKCRAYNEIKNGSREKSPVCAACKWSAHNECEERIEGEEMWRRFHDGLYKEIWELRYPYYRAAADFCVNVRDGMTADQVVAEVLEKKEKFLQENA